MKITAIRVHAVPLPYRTLSHARMTTPQIELDDTIVAIETGEGVTGYGESCPLNPNYLEATAGGLRAALEWLCPKLIGRDPRETGAINTLMDRTARGQAAAKSAVDLALWDILGKAAGLPAKTLLGGSEVDGALLYDSIPMDTPDTMVATVENKRSHGIKVFQVKLGQGAEPDIERMRAIADILKPGEKMMCDANRGWTQEDARRVAAAADTLPPDLDLLIEQPCATHEECVTIRRMCRRPMILDEVIDNVGDLARAVADDALDAVVIKVSHAGGLSRARDMARFAAHMGIRMRIEDTVGADIVRSAVAHLAATVPERWLLAAYAHPAPMTLAETDTDVRDGRLFAGSDVGLGVKADDGVLGEPVAAYA